MNTYRSLALPLLVIVLGLLAFAPGQVAQGQSTDQLGTVNFQNSCSPAVQASFQRSVAMLHSFRYGEAEKAFREVLAQDPSCAIATWGIAAILMSNPLAGVGSSPQGAQRAQAAIDEGRKIGAKTPRERDYIEAVAAYYEDWANRPERTRQANRAKAFEALAARYPDDDEAQIFYALYLAATQSLTDQTYATYLKAAEILEKRVRQASGPSRRRALPDPQLRLPADRRRRDCRRRGATRTSRPRRRTRCTCPRTSSRASAPGGSRRRPTSARRRRRSRTRTSTSSCTPWTTWCTRSCSSPATATRAGVVEAAAAVTGASRRFAGPYALAGDPGPLRGRARRLEAGRWPSSRARASSPTPSP